MKTGRKVIAIIGVLIFSYSFVSISGQTATKSKQTTTRSVQTKPKTPQTKPKAAPAVTKPAKPVSKPKVAKPTPAGNRVEAGIVRIGKQTWAAANLDVSKFRNGDSIPEAKTNKEWVAAGEAGKPACCYYNNDPATGKKYGRLYNWYAVNDPRGLAPAGWSLPSDEDWGVLTFYLGGQSVAGTKLKSTRGWADDNNGTNESGFNGLPGGYRVENGQFLNLGNIGTWWSSTEDRSLTAFDHYLVLSGNFNRSSNPRQRGESVRCIRK